MMGCTPPLDCVMLFRYVRSADRLPDLSESETVRADVSAIALEALLPFTAALLALQVEAVLLADGTFVRLHAVSAPAAAAAAAWLASAASAAAWPSLNVAGTPAASACCAALETPSSSYTMSCRITAAARALASERSLSAMADACCTTPSRYSSILRNQDIASCMAPISDRELSTCASQSCSSASHHGCSQLRQYHAGAAMAWAASSDHSKSSQKCNKPGSPGLLDTSMSRMLECMLFRMVTAKPMLQSSLLAPT